MDAQGHRVGPKTKPVAEIASMEEFVKEYEAQLAYATEAYYFRIRNRNERFNQKHYPEPFLSLFCFDCIGRGLVINDGGAIYPTVHGFGIMGIGTVCESLAAIEKVVFLDKKATLAELRDALIEYQRIQTIFGDISPQPVLNPRNSQAASLRNSITPSIRM